MIDLQGCEVSNGFDFFISIIYYVFINICVMFNPFSTGKIEKPEF